jgi:DNA invertase Pin-like site-specific DNA recombinase
VPSNLQSNCRITVAARGWTVVTVQVDRIIAVAKGRNRLPGLAAVLGAIARHEVDVVVVQWLHHLGTSMDSLLETLAALHRHGVTLVVHDHANLVETGGLLAAADLLLEARRAYRRENIVAGQLRARASGVRFGRPPVPPSRLEKVRVALREGQGVRHAARSAGISAAKVSRIKAQMITAEELT